MTASLSPDPGALITPVVLTFNEEPNISRSLESLRWAARVVVVDSGSTDRTAAIARVFPNVSWHVRPFDTHGAQWEFAIRQTGIDTPFVLALDADYAVPGTFVDECRSRFLAGTYNGAVAGFDYRVLGRTLMGSVYPAKAVIFRPSALRIEQPGHTQEMLVVGPVYTFEARLVHEDLKPVDRFVASQLAYARLEARRLANGGRRWQDTVRRLGLMPVVSGLAAYIRSGGPLRGKAALRYAYERATFECVLAMQVLEDARSGEPMDPRPVRAEKTP